MYLGQAHFTREDPVQTTGRPPTSLRNVTAYKLASLIVTRNVLYSRANMILRTALETMSCSNGHHTSTYNPTMIERPTQGAFSDDLLSFHVVRQVASPSPYQQCCSGIDLWQHHEKMVSTTRTAIQALLNTIHQVGLLRGCFIVASPLNPQYLMLSRWAPC